MVDDERCLDPAQGPALREHRPDVVDQHGQRLAGGGVLGGDPLGERAHLVERAEIGRQESGGVCRVRRIDSLDRLGAAVGVAPDHGD